jgi:peptidoglycan/xylan/chitin deacetylase (PgdA/CDA1 family)
MIVVLAIMMSAFWVMPIKANAVALDKGMVTFTFDDGLSPHYTTAYPILSKAGIPATEYVVTDYVGDGAAHLTWAQIWTLTCAGWEIGNHTASHVSLLGVSSAEAVLQVETAREVLRQHGIINVGAFNPPFGDFDDQLVTVLRGTGISSLRQAWTEDSYLNAVSTFNEWALNVVSVKASMSFTKDIKPKIDAAITQKAWLILVFHGVVAAPSDNDDVSTTVFQQIVTYVKNQKALGKLNTPTISAGTAKMIYYRSLP